MAIKTLTDSIVEAVQTLYGTPIERGSIVLQQTKKEFEGDYTFVVFPLLKISKKNPELTANDIGSYLIAHNPTVKSFNVIKGFLNIELQDAYWIDFLMGAASDDNFGMNSENIAATYVIEYSSPNTNKPLHLGHIRNNLLGQSLAHILSFAGHKVYRVNLVNDRGIHICKSMLAWEKWGNGETPDSSGIKGDHLAGKYYVLFEKEYRKEMGKLIARGLSEEEAKKQAPLIIEAQELLRKWEQNDSATKELWQQMNIWVLEGFEKTYKKLGISFDKTYFESETYLHGKELVNEGLQKGIFSRKEDGSVWIDLSDEGLDEKLLLRADGTSVYMTQDLGTAWLRYQDFNADKYVYVVGNEQNYHFDVLKKISHKLNKPWAEGLYHLSYGMVELPEGKMKSREGKVVDADDLIDEMIHTAKTHTEALGKTEDFSPEEAEQLFYLLAMGALKYFILKVNPKKNMIFNPEESIDFNGNTGPFIQYSYVRINSLMLKAENIKERVDDIVHNNTSLLDKEKSLLKLLHEYPSVVLEAAQELSPALISNYLYEVAKEFNQFYHELPVLKEPDPQKQALRLFSAKLCGAVLKSGMDLLGIDMPQRM